MGKDAPEESKRNDSGVPVENTFDFFLLIGGPRRVRNTPFGPQDQEENAAPWGYVRGKGGHLAKRTWRSTGLPPAG
jgi:hypothetical protein